MNTKKDMGGIFGGYLALVNSLGEVIAIFFVFMLTGKNYKKLSETDGEENNYSNYRIINLAIGWLALSAIGISIGSFYIDGFDFIGFFLAILFGLFLLTLISELIRISFVQKEKNDESRAKKKK